VNAELRRTSNRFCQIEFLDQTPWTAKVLPPQETCAAHGKWRKPGPKSGQQRVRRVRRRLVLHHNVRLEALPVLRDQVGGESAGEFSVESKQNWRGDRVGNAAAKRANSCHLRRKRDRPSGDLAQCGFRGDVTGKVVEQAQMRRDVIQVRWIVPLAKLFKVLLRFRIERQREYGDQNDGLK
jgi:hypothetical protein